MISDHMRKLIEDGHAYKNGHEYFGIASDGEHVYLGTDADPGSMNGYLEDNPTPDTW